MPCERNNNGSGEGNDKVADESQEDSFQPITLLRALTLHLRRQRENSVGIARSASHPPDPGARVPFVPLSSETRRLSLPSAVIDRVLQIQIEADASLGNTSAATRHVQEVLPQSLEPPFRLPTRNTFDVVRLALEIVHEGDSSEEESDHEGERMEQHT